MLKQSGSIDTNVLLRLQLNDVPQKHKAAVQLIENGSTYTVADITFIEIVFVLGHNYEFSRAQIAEAITGLVSLTELNCNRTILETALSVFEAHSSLSFVD